MNRFYTDEQLAVATPEYDTHFWNAMRSKTSENRGIEKGRIVGADTYRLPAGDTTKFLKLLRDESLFRRIATTVNACGSGFKIVARDCKDLAVWVDETEEIPIYEGIRDFTVNDMDSHKLACFVKFDEDFIRDATFDFNDYLLRRFARTFGRAEEKAFISGDGIKQPKGIIHPDAGAELGTSSDALTYDSVIDLFFSLKPEYRDRAVWIMNDETALALRSLKDAAGNYLWRDGDDRLLGRTVIVSNYMPSAASGNRPIVFGDFSYYWVIVRKPVGLRPLFERFAAVEQIGYLGTEFLDGRLVRREAVKALEMTAQA